MSRMLSYRSAFTIVEMLVVVTVVAILAAVVTVGFNGIRGRAIESVLKSSISSAMQKIETYNIENGRYPESLAAIGVDSDDNAFFQYSGPSSQNTYCMSITSPRSETVAYFAQNGYGTPREGVCEGHVGPGGEDEPEVFSFARTAHGDGSLGLTVHVGEEWNSVQISWDAQSGAQRYELQTRNPSSYNAHVNSFYSRSASDGSSYCSGVTTSCSSGLAPSTTSLNWTNSISALPVSAGQVFEYRLRYYGPDGFISDWDTASMANPIAADSDTRPVTGFKVVPNAAYTNVTLSWDQVPNFSPKMADVRYEVESRNPDSPNGLVNSFKNRTLSDGSGNCSGASATCSSHIAYTQNTATWTNAISGVPASAGQTFEYRIRVRVSGQNMYYSPWSDVVSVSYPIQNDSDVPPVSGLDVVYGGGYANVSISWNQVPSFAPKMSEVTYELQTRNPASSSGSANTFYARLLSDGSGTCSGGASSSCSNGIPPTTTSLVWTNTATAVPASTGQTFEYRIRARVNGAKLLYGPWSSVVSLSR